jgi:hypothetical protein
MKRILTFSLSVISCMGLLLATERRAMAYIDPSQGLLFVQSLGAAVAASAYFMRNRILALFGKKKDVAAAPITAARPVSSVRPVAVQKGDVRNAA